MAVGDDEAGIEARGSFAFERDAPALLTPDR